MSNTLSSLAGGGSSTDPVSSDMGALPEQADNSTSTKAEGRHNREGGRRMIISVKET